ncbi:hypothetical protein Tco_0078508 [Tanacetum coccineum]
MSAIIDIRYVLTQKALDASCDKFHIPEEAFRINISQLSVIRAAKSGWISFSKRSDNAPLLLLETTIGRTIPLLPIAPDHAKSKLEVSVDRLFDEGGSGNQTEQGDSAGGGKGADIQPVSEAVDTVVEDVAPLQPRRQRKRKTVILDVVESSHPAKKLREDHRTSSGTSVGSKSMSAV